MVAVRKLKDKYSYSDYEKWDDSENWEIIGGDAYNMAPSPNTEHQKIGGKILGKLFQYLEDKECELFYELDVVLSEEDVVKPDIIVVCDKNKIKRRNIEGAPDLVVEILSPSTAKNDRTLKYELYKKSGVREYWIVDPYNLEIDVHSFEKDEMNYYFYENFEENSEEEQKNLLEIGIFNGEFKLDVNYVFGE